MNNNQIYVIIASSEVENMCFNSVKETSADTLRYNNDGTKTFVKFEGDTPDCLTGKTQYTHSEFLAILNDPDGEWYSEPDF